MSNLRIPEKPLQDSMGRHARYLRISITDRCNLDCFYCRDPRQTSFIPHRDILRYEEIERFVQITRKMGIGKVRITGGEPFVRKDCAAFLLNMRRLFPDLRLSLTTNGVLLQPWLEDLVKVAPESINISLDSFDPQSFARITGHDRLADVLSNIDRLLCRNMRVKLNAVALRGVTDREIDNFVYAARQMPVDLRFIEFMPMGASTRWTEEAFLSTGELRALLMEKTELKAEQDGDQSGTAGPARMFALPGARGRIGFISALSDHFCLQCNRLRLTSDGKLRTCLFSDQERPLGEMLRNRGVPDEAIASAVAEAHEKKPIGAEILRKRGKLAVANKEMTGIGG